MRKLPQGLKALESRLRCAREDVVAPVIRQAHGEVDLNPKP